MKSGMEVSYDDIIQLALIRAEDFIKICRSPYVADVRGKLEHWHDIAIQAKKLMPLLEAFISGKPEEDSKSP